MQLDETGIFGNIEDLSRDHEIRDLVKECAVASQLAGASSASVCSTPRNGGPASFKTLRVIGPRLPTSSGETTWQRWPRCSRASIKPSAKPPPSASTSQVPDVVFW